MKKLLANFLILFLFSCAQLENEVSPNFIIIYADDLGFGDVGKFSPKDLSLPNIKRLEEEGQVWTNFYSADAVCSPSRGALLTGKLPINSGLYGDSQVVLFPNSKVGMPSSEKTIAEVLSQNGYETAILGKWHLGDKEEFFPTRHGFKYWYGIPYSNDMDWEIDGITSDVLFKADSETEVMKIYMELSPKIRENLFDPDISDWNVPLISSKKVNDSYEDLIIERPVDQRTTTKRYTEEALNFIRNSHKNDKPFFLYLAHHMPHVPLFRSDAFVGKSGKGIYGDVIQEIDWSIGMVLDLIANLGIKEKTYLIFTSDNGPWLIMDAHSGSAGPLKGGKHTTFEGGMRVMTYFWGSKIEPSVVNYLGMQTDIFNTILSLSNIQTHSSLKDSYNLKNSILEGHLSPREFIPYYSGSELRAFRYQNLKAHFITQGAYGRPPEREEHIEPVFYDLQEDISESKPINSHEYKNQIRNLLLEVGKHSKSIVKKDPIFDGQN